ncbi:hypothetical protein FHR81_000894 [Actinoalloteichus hoggarensis]|uniref:Uncharacterized protein n=1 Tax=Actinoalloteichus hoggarensis TaxID=1470176 RepID=A0A221W1H8_9PSEU|nr:hypothetical protein [Actinoalloteichus hoggarensis]ASO19431.1 hypothetical protein AHOG_08935 [Actinoalloteichus hoggarensis]MBB5919865.1 hypothetical protein [Actinoalloteichus hoggarensis]
MATDNRDWARYATSVGRLGSELADEVRRGVATWRDPRAKAERRRKRARRGLAFRVGLAALTGAGAFLIGSDPGIEFGEVVLGGVAVVATASSVSSAVRVSRLYRTPLPEAAAPPPELPPVGSAARAPIQRLTVAEESLRELLDRLSEPASGVPVDSVVQIRLTAADAASAVHDGAQRLQAVERAAEAAPAAERAALTPEIRRLAEQLEESVDGYGRLVAAAGRAVAASASAAEPQAALTDASDRLAGLAAALRELSRGPGL